MNNLNNLAKNVLMDESKGEITYYFAGKKHPFVQLNATGSSDNYEDVVCLAGDKNHPIRELVGLFGSHHSWQPADAAESVLLNNFSLKTRKLMVPMMIDGNKIETFLPSKHEYASNPAVAGKVYDECGGFVWSRSRSFGGGAWFVCNSNGDMIYNGISSSCHYAPAFNLDLSKILMARDAVCGEAIMDYSDSFKPYKCIKESVNNEVKFLAQIDDTVIHVEKKDDGTLICRTKVDNIIHSYLSAVIVDKNDNILYYNLLSGFNRFNDDDGEKYDESIQRIKLPEGLPEGCRIGLFTETRNAEYYMDTCGEITWLSIKDGQIGDVIESDNSDLNKSIATNKKIVELPYEIGDTVYIVESSDNHYSVIRAKVDSYVIGKNAKIVLHVYDDCGDFKPKELLLDRITESIFANKEDALKKLSQLL